jgi:SAM-dependent methyltransferase
VITARIGDPATHRRIVGPFAGPRLAARVAHLVDDGPWQSLDDLAGVAAGSLDTVVAVGALCAWRDLEAGVAVLHRALAPGGRLLFLEHVGRPGGAGLVHRAADPVWSALPGGCHVDHDVVAALRHGGLVVADLERCTLPSAVPVLRPWVQGVAVKKEDR